MSETGQRGKTTVGIVGLGLIGGSLARAYKEYSDFVVYGYDINDGTVLLALTDGCLDGRLDDETIKECDLILIALYPQAAIDYVEQKKDLIPASALVIDCCGVKGKVCDALFPAAKKSGFTYIGGHPMAGTQYSGFLKSKANMFKSASMILVPPVYDDIMLLDRAKKLLDPLGFSRYVVTTARKHDEMIAFTSQMAHVISNAFIKSPTAKEHKGYSAGSYKDMTRVASLNEDMWTELFLSNSTALEKEIGILIDSLCEYRDAVKDHDADRLRELLREGRIAKEEIDGSR
ncbi:MAG: prephenate dehydrogenase [Lachnospiraceae bacterium]|nr:prephenate dehydrogenase [Lachnospiraceae bacterium]